MPSFQDSIEEYRIQLKQGMIQGAYRGLMEYILCLRTDLQAKHPDYIVSGSIYYGYMDMTYFSFFPNSLKERNLKIAIVFLHEAFRFEAWLAGLNKQIQAKYWKLFKESNWNQYHLVTPGKGVDAILDHVLVDCPDFRDLDALSSQIEREALTFIEDIEQFFADH